MAIGLIVSLGGLSITIIAAVREHRAQSAEFFQPYWLAP
jgi:hypothetical protein